jgi:hypothetical protein
MEDLASQLSSRPDFQRCAVSIRECNRAFFRGGSARAAELRQSGGGFSIRRYSKPQRPKSVEILVM